VEGALDTEGGTWGAGAGGAAEEPGLPCPWGVNGSRGGSASPPAGTRKLSNHHCRRGHHCPCAPGFGAEASKVYLWSCMKLYKRSEWWLMHNN